MRPFSITRILSQTDNTAELCVTATKVEVSDNFFKATASFSSASSSRLLVGSSRRIMGGSFRRILANATRCC